MIIDREGLDFILAEEGYCPYVYNDPSGYATVGVGHLLHRSHFTAAEAEMYGTRSRPRMTKSGVLALLDRDLRAFERGVELAVHRALLQHEFDACVSLAFNIGVGAFASSSVVRELNAGHVGAAADAFLLWRNSGGRPILLARRQRERALFLKAEPPARKMPWLLPDEERWVVEYDALLRARKDVTRRRVLRAVMIERRKAIWRAAQASGWGKLNRRRRYESLRACTV